MAVTEQKVQRVLAWLMRNEGVEPEAIERAVASAAGMLLAEDITLCDPGASLRRAFVTEQVRCLAFER